MNEPDRNRVSVKFSVAGLDGSDDDKDGVENPEDGEENKADQDQAKDSGDDVVDEHRDLEVERFFAVGVDFGGITALGQPDDEGWKDVTGEMHKDAKQSTGVTQGVPAAHISDDGRADRSGGCR